MKDDAKTKARLIEEVRDLRSQLKTLKGKGAEHQQSEAILGQADDRLAILVQEQAAELRQANAALQVAKEYADTLIQSSLDMIIAVDQERQIVEFNTAAEQVFGYTKNDVLGKHVDLLYVDPIEGTLVNRTTIQTGGRTVSVRNRRKNGEVFEAELAASVVHDAAGNVLGVMGISRDLSGQKHVEQSLRLSAERLRLLHNMDQSILEAQSLEAIARVALSHIRQLIPCQRASIALLDQETQEVTILAVNAESGPQTQAGTQFPLQMVADTEQLQRGGRLVADVETLASPSPLDSELRAGGLRSWVNISLIAGGQLIGLLNLEATVPRFFTAEYLDIGNEAAQPLAIALQQTRLQEEIQRQTLLLAKTNRELRTEIIERKRAEQALREAHNELEQRVHERTAALATANAALHAEIAERKQAEAALHALSHQLLQAQESERREIARELHDEVGQALTALKINLDSLQTKLNTSPDPSGSPDTTDRLTDSLHIASQLLQQVRDLSLDLRPSLLDDLGLVAALRWYVDRQAQRVGFVAEVLADPLEPRPSPTIETVCFRIAQEAVTNMVRHAQAQRVQIELRQDPHALVLRIRDDGIGFDVQAAQERAARGGSMGLRGMYERVQLVGGKINTISAPGCGTEIRAYVPLGEKEGEHNI